MQSKLESITESLTNNVTGILVSYGMGLIVYPMFGFPVTYTQNFAIMAIFTAASFIRSYCVRRVFNHRTRIKLQRGRQ